MAKLTLLLLSLVFISSCAQSQKGIISRGAYVTIRQPGMLPVDDGGNVINSGPDSIFTVFVETGTQKIEWGIFWIGKRSYSVIPTPAKKLPGTRDGEDQTGSGRVYTASRGNKLWQLELVPYDRKLALPSASKPGQVLMKGKYGSTPFSISIAHITVLKSPPSY
jgi:hypothetical protein